MGSNNGIFSISGQTNAKTSDRKLTKINEIKAERRFLLYMYDCSITTIY